MNVLTVVPALLTSNFLGGAAIVVPVVIFATAFALWCPSVWTGQAAVPRRSLVLGELGIALSAANLVLGREYGLQYQGLGYVRLVAVVSVAWWPALIAVGVQAVRRPSAHRNLWFHVALFSWLSWYAVPYMGELP